MRLYLRHEEPDTDPDALVAAARRMHGALAERRASDTEACRLSSETVAEFRTAGFFKVLQPAGFGGLELPAATLFRLEMALAEADMSAAWVMANMSVAAFHAALFDPRAQADVWRSTPDALIASANMPGGRLTPDGDGAWQLSGRWRFSSGVDHGDWFILGVIADMDGASVAGACLVSRADIEILPDWDVVGLRGTGSHAIRIGAASVPRYRFLAHIDRFRRTAPGLQVNRGNLYRLPLPQLLFRSISSASIGGLAGMLDAFVAANRGRTSMMAQTIAKDPHVQTLCGLIMADLQALRGGLAHDLSELAAHGSAGDAPDLAMRRAARLNATRVADRCFQWAADLYRAAGAAALYKGDRLLMIFNDLLAARQHAANQYELHARHDGAVLFGEEREDILL